MADIEFRLRRSDDDFEPFYVRIAESGDGAALAFTENDESEEAGTRAIAALRAGELRYDTVHDRGNDVWFFRLTDLDGEVLFRSLPCPSEDAMQATIERITAQAIDAEIIDERRND